MGGAGESPAAGDGDVEMGAARADGGEDEAKAKVGDEKVTDEEARSDTRLAGESKAEPRTVTLVFDPSNPSSLENFLTPNSGTDDTLGLEELLETVPPSHTEHKSTCVRICSGLKSWFDVTGFYNGLCNNNTQDVSPSERLDDTQSVRTELSILNRKHKRLINRAKLFLLFSASLIHLMEDDKIDFSNKDAAELFYYYYSYFLELSDHCNLAIEQIINYGDRLQAEIDSYASDTNYLDSGNAYGYGSLFFGLFSAATIILNAFNPLWGTIGLIIATPCASATVELEKLRIIIRLSNEIRYLSNVRSIDEAEIQLNRKLNYIYRRQSSSNIFKKLKGQQVVIKADLLDKINDSALKLDTTDRYIRNNTHLTKEIRKALGEAKEKFSSLSLAISEIKNTVTELFSDKSTSKLTTLFERHDQDIGAFGDIIEKADHKHAEFVRNTTAARSNSKDVKALEQKLFKTKTAFEVTLLSAATFMQILAGFFQSDDNRAIQGTLRGASVFLVAGALVSLNNGALTSFKQGNRGSIRDEINLKLNAVKRFRIEASNNRKELDSALDKLKSLKDPQAEYSPQINLTAMLAALRQTIGEECEAMKSQIEYFQEKLMRSTQITDHENDLTAHA